MAENQTITNLERKFNFEDTTATRKIFDLSKRIRAVAGGTSASKTISILIWLIDYCQTRKNKRASVVSESFPHLTDGAILDFKNIMQDRGYWDDDRWHDTKHTYTFETGTVLQFFSPNTYSKAHGPRRDVLFINEANNMKYKIVDQLMVRTREIVWMDWNPSVEFWFYTELLPHRREDIDFITLTYKDNEALDENTVHEIESHKNDKMWWQVYGLGQLGEIEGKIYRHWKIIGNIPEGARLVRRGLDFGYSDDPSALIDVYEYNGGYILDEVLFHKGLSNKKIADVILACQEQCLVIADSAEPKSIDEIKDCDITILPSKKGADSVNFGIRIVQAQKIKMTERSLHLIKEYRNYLWMVDKDGTQLPIPSHAYSHSMDAVRYAIVSLLRDKTGSFHIYKPEVKQR